MPPIPSTMQAVHLVDHDCPVEARRVPVPEPGPNEVLVRIAAAPINPTDVALVRGRRAALPVVPGAEASGTVVKAGPGLLPRLWLGRRVACASTPGRGGTWAEYMVTRAKLCFPLAASVSLEQGAMLIVNPMTALAFFDLARAGRHAALVSTAAASALGRMLLRLGRQQRVPVIHVVRRPAHVELLRGLGAEWVLDSSRPDFAASLREHAHRLKATLLLDAVAGEMTATLLAAAPFGSTVLVYGRLAGEPIQVDARTLFYEDKRLAGFYLANWQARRSLPQTLAATRRVQRLAAAELQTAIQQRVPLSAAAEAIEFYMSNMTAGKVLLVPGLTAPSSPTAAPHPSPA